MKLGYLCVTGSLGWGYYDIDHSDVDLRGVYYKTENDRFIKNIGDQREFKKLPLECTFWSFDKFWGLLRKSNPSCIEWLLSPTIFSDALFDQFREYAKMKMYNPFTLAKHYVAMAKGNYRDYDKKLSPKKVRYIVRALESAKAVLNDELPIMDVTGLDCSESQDFHGMISALDKQLDAVPKKERKDNYWFRDYKAILSGKVFE